MSTTRSLSPSAAAALFPEDARGSVELHFVSIHSSERPAVENLLGVLVTLEDYAGAVPSDDFLLRARLSRTASAALATTSAYSSYLDEDAALRVFLEGGLSPQHDLALDNYITESAGCPVNATPVSEGFLVEGYAPLGGDGFVPVRIVEDFENDPLVLQQAHDELQRNRYAAVGVPGLASDGLLLQIASATTHPAGLSLSAMMAE